MKNYKFELVGIKTKEINIRANNPKEANKLLKSIVQNSDLISFVGDECECLRSELVAVVSDDGEAEPICSGDCENCPFNESEG